MPYSLASNISILSHVSMRKHTDPRKWMVRWFRPTLVGTISHRGCYCKTEVCEADENLCAAREQPKSIRHVSWDTKFTNNLMISQYPRSSAVLYVYQHILRLAWLISVLITRNRLILMNKWFVGCGNVKLFELHKNGRPNDFRSWPRLFLSVSWYL